MKKAILYRISYLVEVDEEEISDHKGKEKFWKLAWGKLPEQEIVLDEQHKAEWQSTRNLIRSEGCQTERRSMASCSVMNVCRITIRGLFKMSSG